MEMKQNSGKELPFRKISWEDTAHLFGFACYLSGWHAVVVSTSEVLAAQAPAYIFTDLGRVGDLSSEANAVSAGGVVVGSIMYNAGGTPLRRAFYYYQGVRHFDFIASTQKMISTAHAVNASGCVVGSTQAVKDLAPIISVYGKARTPAHSMTVPTSVRAWVAVILRGAINSKNLVGDPKTASGEYHAFSMRLGATGDSDLGTLSGWMGQCGAGCQ